VTPAFWGHPRFETVSATKYRSFASLRATKPKFDFIWHHHPEVELTYIFEGSGVRYVGNSVQPFQAGDFCLIGADVPHAYGSHPTMRGRARWMVLHFLPERFGADFWRFPETRALRKLLESSARGIRFHGSGTGACLQVWQTLDRRPGGLGGLANFFRLFDLLNGLPRKTTLMASIRGAPGPPSIDGRLRKILSWMESAEPEEITQREAARLARMSPAAFSRFFRRRTGQTFVRRLNELKIARACVSLAVEARPIAQIAMESGFGNLSNFNRRFKEIVGMPPRDYLASQPRQPG
jgi:AraC-like DNA-binding protein